MKRLIIISIVTILCNYTKAQYRHINWCFADSIGLNFSTTPPAIFECSLTSYNNSSSISVSCISDETGNLLFYTNGNKVWNKEHNLMQNGSGLFGIWSSDYPYIYPLIIPKPHDENIYFLFHGSEPVYYSLIDISYNDGLGKVIDKNKLLETPWPNNSTHKLNAVKHGNGRDWWIIFPSIYYDWADDSYGLPTLFYILLITPEGIIQMPTIEGEIFNEDDNRYDDGQSKFSPDGSMLGLTCGKKVWLYHFDRCSGVLNYYYTIDSIWTGNPNDYVSGFEFSPDGYKLYITKIGGYNGVSRLYQYDLNADDIKTSQVIIHQNNSDYSYQQLQLAPNGKIYATMPPDNSITYDSGVPQTMSISIIHNPNEPGLTCNYEHLGQYIGGKKVEYGLPNMPNYNLGVLPKSACDTLSTSINNIQEDGTFHIYPNPAFQYISIQSNIEVNEKLKVEIYNMQGISVYSSDYQINNSVDISKLNSGVYVVRLLEDNKNIFTENLLILN
ncbi:MAG: T9SS type A sorting domain-containing protein [Bacteroidetes bacterium]|nr:T9SS type A sorting domain-containing protein [Bacteroidota bacterium]